jgi:hypothetical protein
MQLRARARARFCLVIKGKVAKVANIANIANDLSIPFLATLCALSYSSRTNKRVYEPALTDSGGRE